jgi:signal transduction histidine kinase
MEDLSKEDPKRQDLERIVQEAGRCKEIVKSLLEFARQTEPKRESIDINRAITDGLFFLENQALFHNIRITKRLDPSLPWVTGHAGQLKQAFMNIISMPLRPCTEVGNHYHYLFQPAKLCFLE